MQQNKGVSTAVHFFRQSVAGFRQLIVYLHDAAEIITNTKSKALRNRCMTELISEACAVLHILYHSKLCFNTKRISQEKRNQTGF